jgi:hypothetical protein
MSFTLVTNQEKIPEKYDYQRPEGEKIKVLWEKNSKSKDSCVWSFAVATVTGVWFGCEYCKNAGFKNHVYKADNALKQFCGNYAKHQKIPDGH